MSFESLRDNYRQIVSHLSYTDMQNARATCILLREEVNVSKWNEDASFDKILSVWLGFIRANHLPKGQLHEPYVYKDNKFEILDNQEQLSIIHGALCMFMNPRPQKKEKYLIFCMNRDGTIALCENKKASHWKIDRKLLEEVENKLKIIVEQAETISSIFIKNFIDQIPLNTYENFVMEPAQFYDLDHQAYLKTDIFCANFLWILSAIIYKYPEKRLFEKLTQSQIVHIMHTVVQNAYPHLYKPILNECAHFFSDAETTFLQRMIMQILEKDDVDSYKFLFDALEGNKRTTTISVTGWLLSYQDQLKTIPKILMYLIKNLMIENKMDDFLPVLNKTRKLDDSIYNLYRVIIQNLVLQIEKVNQQTVRTLLLGLCSNEGISFFPIIFSNPSYTKKILSESDIIFILKNLMEENCFENFKIAWKQLDACSLSEELLAELRAAAAALENPDYLIFMQNQK